MNVGDVGGQVRLGNVLSDLESLYFTGDSNRFGATRSFFDPRAVNFSFL